MDDTILRDLKQFIAATISQQTTEIIERLDKVDARFDKVEMRLDNVETKIDDLSASVGEAIESSNQVTDDQLKDHSRRIARLEHKIA